MTHEIVQIPIEDDSNYPTIGETTTGLGEHLVKTGFISSIDGFTPIRRDALAIVRNCRRFSYPDGTRTGLVVGYVQSGKTASMTCVSALARDNGCRIVILLAGVTTNLLEQNAHRFKTDLRSASGKSSAWRILNTESLGEQDLHQLQQAVNEWKDPNYDELDRQTFLFMVLKNHAHLDRLQKMLGKVNLAGIPALILDDEADQAGLNTSPDKPDPSTTYLKIKRLREALPHHTYLQYTATPQAPLLIALDDMLSPAFAELVEPGDGYTGGQAFFGRNAIQGLLRAIPSDDQFKPGTPPGDPPDSLLEAMQVFFVGSAVAAIRGKPTPRSMLIHPSQRTSDHAVYMRWVSEIVKRWVGSLRSSDQDDKNDTLEELHRGYEELAKTDHDLPPFESLIPRLVTSLSRVSLKEVNSQGGTEVDWENSDIHILVGGEKLNRGFTVEGLTVTYMPRDAGGWNADTLQQRARFFGYKKGFLRLCRLYLHPDVISAFRSYVIHEDDVRKQLAAHRGKPLRAWRRAFFLDADMRPTRHNVLFDPIYKISTDKPWFLQRYPHSDEVAISRNSELVEKLEANCSFQQAPTEYFEHGVTEISLKQALEELLVSFDVRGPDGPAWYGQIVTLRDVLETDPDANVLLLKMAAFAKEPRERSPDKSGDGIALHQGRSSSKKVGSYPGDAKMVDVSLITIQIHWIDVIDGYKHVPALAIHIPSTLRREDVLVQDKGEHA
jgi:hypothetical protein